MNFELTEEQKLVQKTARDFSKSELLPGAVERDISKIWPTEAIKKMADLGFMGMMVNPKWNGGGMDTISYVIAMEEICESPKVNPDQEILGRLAERLGFFLHRKADKNGGRIAHRSTGVFQSARFGCGSLGCLFCQAEAFQDYVVLPMPAVARHCDSCRTSGKKREGNPCLWFRFPSSCHRSFVCATGNRYHVGHSHRPVCRMIAVPSLPRQFARQYCYLFPLTTEFCSFRKSLPNHRLHFDDLHTISSRDERKAGSCPHR